MNFFFKQRNEYYNSSSEDELEELLALTIETQRLEGNQGLTSRRGANQRRLFIERNPIQGHERLFNDYFADPCTYPADKFRRRFRMCRELFLCINYEIEAQEPYFQQTRNAAGRLGLSSLQKMTAAYRMLAYGITADLTDEYVRIGESTAIKSLKKFVKAIISVFGDEYLKSPNEGDIARLLAEGESRGFPGMLGSIDCMHWKWKNCPSAWKGMFTGHIQEPTIILEAVASYNLWIWHAFFGLPGSHNDINVLERSTLFSELAQERAPACNYSINGHNYTMGYYLGDGIYPPWATFVKTIPAPQSNKHKHYAMRQESVRKDVERAFGVLQSRFAIVRGPVRYFRREILNDIMLACVILHNMIVEDERHLHNQLDISAYEQGDESPPTPEVSTVDTSKLTYFIERHQCIRNRKLHFQLQTDLIEHLWDIHSEA